MSEAMELTQDTLDAIWRYVRGNLAEWIAQQTPPALLARDIELRERTVRVEEELKAQRELMRQGFEQVDRRFEQIDKRFEQIDKRFETVDKRFDDQNRAMSRWFTLITIMLGIVGLGVMAVGFVQ